MKNTELPGVEIASHVNGVSIGDARFEPFFAAAESMGAADVRARAAPGGQDRIVGPSPSRRCAFRATSRWRPPR
jgi:aminocarboxymuconate-semialdehyde decarboxylase